LKANQQQPINSKVTVGEQKNLVVINGKTYDSVSGNLVSAHKDSVPISDFKVSAIQQTTTPVHDNSQPHRRHSHLAHHKQQKSITLKRAPRTHSTSISNSKSNPLAATDIITAHRESALPHSQSRLDRAKQVNRSTAISRFNPITISVEKRQEPVAVQPTPIHSRELSPASYMPTLSSQVSDEDIFSQALSRAESHKQAPLKSSRRRHRLANKLGLKPKVANVLAGALVVIVLAGFVAYQNASYISLKIAASHSGLAAASLPGYKPSGFSLKRNIAASPGQITINFHSNSDDRAFAITQSSSNWDSQTLADSFLANKQPQRIDQANGKTVYVYGDSNATWVDGGVWYRIEGKSSLTSDQLLKIANSF
jgi:hypothetical protein